MVGGWARNKNLTISGGTCHSGRVLSGVCYLVYLVSCAIWSHGVGDRSGSMYSNSWYRELCVVVLPASYKQVLLGAGPVVVSLLQPGSDFPSPPSLCHHAFPELSLLDLFLLAFSPYPQESTLLSAPLIQITQCRGLPEFRLLCFQQRPFQRGRCTVLTLE